MSLGGAPFALHPAAWAGVLAGAALYAAWTRDPRRHATRRQARCFIGAMLVALCALTWPLADLAAHRLLVALVVQRLLLLLALPPLLFAAIPRELVATLTRPTPIDALARACTKPAPAVVVVTVVAAATLSAPAVDAQASSAIVRGVLDVSTMLAGLVLWAPVVEPFPRTRRRSALGRAGYLVVQSIVPSFMSVVWIFARHPLYAPYGHSRALGLSPLVDQELAGFVAKLGTIFALWTVAFVIVNRSERADEAEPDEEPLTWSDVQRELERLDRKERRANGSPREPGQRW